MTTFLYNDGRRDDMRAASLDVAADAVISGMPDSADKERARKALEAGKFEFRCKGKNSRFFWAASKS